MQPIDLTWKIGGEAGYGIMSVGRIFALTFSRLGFNVFATNDFPSLIRGGHNTFTVRFSVNILHSFITPVNILVALDKETIMLHKDEVVEDGILIYDRKIQLDKGIVKKNFYAVPLSEIAEKTGDKKIMMNIVAIGASLAFLGDNFHILSGIVKEAFGRKGRKIVKSNVDAAKAGYDFVVKHYKAIWQCGKLPKKDNFLITGNEAVSIGAIKAGCKFLSMYPMTPSSAILHFMAAHQKEYHVLAKQTEDEISAINMAIGASFTGVRAMTATSGGGFSLMVEALGLAGLVEAPVVIVNGQRAGPATGMPTKTEQGDLRFVIHAAQGEFPRIVLAPGDVEECFYETVRAFYLAEKYQCPVVILTDKYIAESAKTVIRFKSNIKVERYSMVKPTSKLNEMEFYKRYLPTENGISLRVIPGQKDGMYLASSDEHDESGFLQDDPGIRVKMMDKRFRKLESIRKEIPMPKLYGEGNADRIIISWGSTKGAILDAIELLKKEGINVNLLHFVYIHPFPQNVDVLLNSKTRILVEGNQTAQLGGLIREHTSIDIEHKILKYDGMPFTSDEIYRRVKEVLKKNG